MAGPPAKEWPVGWRRESPDSVERRIVTVLFTDLVGFTTVSEQFDAEDAESRELAREVSNESGPLYDAAACPTA